MKRILFSLLIFSCTVSSVKSQEDVGPVNTGVAGFLTVMPDARSAGMGGAGVALPGNNNAIFHNASTSVTTSGKGGMTYTFSSLMRDYESGHSLNSLGGFYKIDPRNVVLGGFRYYHYPKMDITNNVQGMNQHIRPKEWAVDLGYARELITNLSVSATVRFVHSDMGNLGGAKSSNAVAFDVGAVYKSQLPVLNDASYTMGLQAGIFGSKIKYLNTRESLPAFVKVGCSIDLPFAPIHRLVVATDLGYRISPTDAQSLAISGGAEYILMEHFRLRGGYHYGDKKKGDTSYATAGLGIHYFGGQMDFSWLFAEKESPLKNSFRVSIGYAF